MVSACTSIARARANAGGSSFPRRSARRRIPAAAFADSQYRGGGGEVSRTSDNEHSAAPLGDSEISSVQSSPCDAVPEFVQSVEDDGEVASLIRGEKPGNILDDDPPGPKLASDSMELKPETATLAGKTGPSAGHADVLAGESPKEDEII